MKSIVSWVMTCPGTMIGKPGGYGITKFAETRSGPVSSAGDRFRDRGDGGIHIPAAIAGRVETAADIALVGLAPGIAAVRVGWKCEKFGRSGTSFIRLLHPRIEVDLGVRAALGQAAIDLARHLRQHPDEMRDVTARIVDVGSGSARELREVLLTWML